MDATRPARAGPLVLLAALLVPPLGVWLSEGLTTNFWIAVALTLAAFVPGAVFALVVVLRPGLVRLR